MTITAVLQTDIVTRDLVEAEINWSSQIKEPSRIAVAVHDGVVTLTGDVPSYTEKVSAAKAALRTRGVVAVANDINVVIGRQTGDTDLAERAAHALALDSSVPADNVHVEVSHGVITLTGTVPWNFQRDAARAVITRLTGAREVVNNLALMPRASSVETKSHIEAAFQRQAHLDAGKLDVTVNGTTVTLTGTVSSNAEKQAANSAAWHSPHVSNVINHLRIQP